MYVTGNPKTKKALKAAVAAGDYPSVFNPGLGADVVDGDVSVEGPHYPKPHSWYARVRVAGGKVVKVLS